MESAFLKPLTSSSITPFLIPSHPRFSEISSTRGHYPLCQIFTRRLRCIGGDTYNTSRTRLHCVSSSAASFASGGGGGGSGGGDGGEGGSGGGDAQAEDAAETGGRDNDVIILNVGGMSCGGCASSVKRILESQPQVSSATVNLSTETAIVWPASDAKAVPNWQKQLGEALAKHLTSCGFESNLRGEGAIEGDAMQ